MGIAALIAACALVARGIPAVAALTGGANQTTVAKAPPTGPNGSDPFLWLESQTGARAMAWVHAQNARTLPVLEGDAHFKPLYADALKVVDAKGRIPYPSQLDGAIYNFWQDATHVQGIWRRTTVASYESAHPQWTTVLDMDALSKSENAHIVFRGASCDDANESDCLIQLSNGGEDAATYREFDLKSSQFVKGGFELPRAKQDATWLDSNTLLVSRPWMPGELTKSGYAYDIRSLKRGEPLSSATEVFKGEPSDVSVQAFTLRDGDGHRLTMIDRGVTFFTAKYFLVTDAGVKPVALPEKVALDGMVDGKVIVSLNQDWNVNGKRFTQGSLVALDATALQADPTHLAPTLIFAPGPRQSVDGVSATKSKLLVTIYDNVRGRAFVYTPNADGSWSAKHLALPDDSTIEIADSSLHNERAYLAVTGFLTPTTLWSLDATTDTLAVAKSLPAQFDASNDVVEQHEATSKDGTKVPYFIVHPKHMKLDGANPTVLYAYGGFQVSLTPTYSGTLGKLWLQRGGVYVLANIRGGGEFGPAWHEAAMTVHRQRAYDDFYAVAQDLIARKITSPRRLGIQGGSNGGLLMGVEFTEHPNEWNAVDIQVPLLDMLRFEKIDAGASWVGEYGSVTNPVQRAFLAKISPYNNLRAGVAYPEPFIWTTTKDDRVGPQHARKFAAKLAAMHVPYLFYEVTEGGHGAGANPKEAAHTSALEWTYFTMKLME
ncbi:MAG: S9 family peptidase [bacterium]|nr:S9 family peptidase [bacterium]